MDPSKETSDAVFKVLKADKPNQFCWDCKTRQPTWCSATFGVYICLDCSSVHRNMGVHISFVQSSNLDSWQLKHIRTMKVGGNRSATDFYTKNGGSALLADSDTKKKYSGRVADLYKAELARRVQEDATLYPDGIFVEGADAPAATATAAAGEDDFFSSWDKPAAKPTPAATPTAAPPRIGVAKPIPPAAPRTVTSASLRSNSSTSATGSTTSGTRAGKPASRLGAVSATSGSSARPAKLGAKKAVATIDFDEAERKALAEEERVKQLALTAQREAEEEKARRAAAAAASPSASSSQPSALRSTSTPTTSSSAPLKSPSAEASKPAAGQDVGRLGMGFGRLGLGVTTAAPTSRRANTTTEDAPTTAREKFGNQKAISSEMFFERGAYDPNAVSEARTKLQQFQGATSISSNQYFGREEEEGEDSMGQSGSFTGNESLSQLEAVARDTISRVAAREDVQNAMETIRTGALKLSDYLAHLQ